MHKMPKKYLHTLNLPFCSHCYLTIGHKHTPPGSQRFSSRVSVIVTGAVCVFVVAVGRLPLSRLERVDGSRYSGHRRVRSGSDACLLLFSYTTAPPSDRPVFSRLPWRLACEVLSRAAEGSFLLAQPM